MTDQPRGRPQPREDVLFRQVDEEWVLFDPASDELHVLNLPAALIWMYCVEALTAEEMAERLQDAYGLERDRAHADIERTLARFEEAGLVQR